MKVTILGSGPSSGVPMVGGRWGKCDPDEPKNQRLRASILVENDGTSILVDTSPDCRAQLLTAGVEHLDAVIYTHPHADHSHGIDDLRWINLAMQAPLPVFGDRNTLDQLAERFGYVFEPLPEDDVPVRFYRPVLVPTVIDGPFSISGMDIVPFEQDHGHSTTLGFRFGGFAYSTDVVRMPEAAFGVLEGIDTWVVDCFRRAPHHTHSHLEQTLAWIERVRPRRAVLCHMGGDLDYATLCAELPEGVEPAYDGLELEIRD